VKVPRKVRVQTGKTVLYTKINLPMKIALSGRKVLFIKEIAHLETVLLGQVALAHILHQLFQVAINVTTLI